METYTMNMTCDNCFAKSTRVFDKGTVCTYPTFTSGDYYVCPHCGCTKAKSTVLYEPAEEKKTKK
jgi:hypothetical protein